MSLSVRGRVVSVRPRLEGDFTVLLGPGRRLFSYVTRDPPNLGELVEVQDADPVRLRMQRLRSVEVTMLEGGTMRVLADPYARRVVSPAWVERCHRAVVRRTLHPFQAEGAAWLAERLSHRRGSILADDMGLGKTTQTLAALVAARAVPAIIVCPTSLKENWVRELAYVRPQLRATVVSGGRGRIPPAHVVILNYRLLRAREAQLSALGARLIVFDEAHELKEAQPAPSHQAAVATRLAHRIGTAILLTGTPLLNRPGEIWRLLHILDPEAWPSYKEFRLRYCTDLRAHETSDRVEVLRTSHGKAKRVEELRCLAAPLMLRRLRDEALASRLPPKVRSRVLVRLEPGDQAAYKQAEKNVLLWMRRTLVPGDSHEKQKKSQALLKLTQLRRIAAVGKLRKAIPEYIEAWFQTESRQLVIFSYHRMILARVHQICLDLGLRISRIRGEDKTEKRQQAVDRFHRGETHVFLAPIRSASVGINLQCASDMLFLERMWTPALMAQAEARCHRLGQRHAVSAVYLDAAGTVDEHIASVLASKQHLIDAVVDDVRQQDQASQNAAQETIDEVLRRMTQQKLRSA